MKFEDVLHTGKLWTVVYDGAFFHITNLEQAIYDTIADAASLSCLILDIRPDLDLNALFRPLENSRIHEMLLSREKAKGKRISGHPSWRRLYALKLDDNIYLITGGAIKLTRQMSERPHTLNELRKMESVRNHLLDNGIVDSEGIKDYNDTKI